MTTQMDIKKLVSQIEQLVNTIDQITKQTVCFLNLISQSKKGIDYEDIKNEQVDE
jgi:nitrate/nitrite-specific signal transduction histidine kinase